MNMVRVLEWVTRVKLIIARGSHCELCGYEACPTILNVHHKIEISDGGTHEKDNLIVLCPNCHALEHQKTKKYKTLDEILQGCRTVQNTRRKLPKYKNYRKEYLRKKRRIDPNYCRSLLVKNKMEENLNA
jgi:hypothetical protein